MQIPRVTEDTDAPLHTHTTLPNHLFTSHPRQHPHSESKTHQGPCTREGLLHPSLTYPQELELV